MKSYLVVVSLKGVNVFYETYFADSHCEAQFKAFNLAKSNYPDVVISGSTKPVYSSIEL